MAEKPINLAYDPPPGLPRSTGVPEAHRMTIYDARPVAERLSLDSEGGFEPGFLEQRVRPIVAPGGTPLSPLVLIGPPRRSPQGLRYCTALQRRARG
jgi:hypothetical protein